MSKKIFNNGKHLTIEDSLRYGTKLGEIARCLGTDPTTISKEFKRNRTYRESKSQFGGGCAHRKTCVKKHICNPDCNKQCKKCNIINCYRSCPDFEVKTCNLVTRFPHVCNGCEKRLTCK